MKSFTYSRINNLTGIIVFFIAAIVYCLTVEPTASFWDCGEFIISAYKLEVGHSPGAPFFMLTANAFTQLTGDPSLAARMVNYMSALLSAATIWLLYLSITHLTRRIIGTSKTEATKSNTLIIIASGVVGALAYTFSDTFWFSAVEGEVYAYSSLLTALVFWLILKWEEDADGPYADRWLILIAYITGLSIGVHILNLLCLPAIVLVYYYKKKPEASLLGSLVALIVSALIIIVILYGMVPGTVKVAGWFELLFVNELGLPFHSGLATYLLLLAAAFIWGIYTTRKSPGSTLSRFIFLLVIALLGIPFYEHGTASIVSGIVVLGAAAFYLFSKRIPTARKPTPQFIHTTLICLMMIVVGYSSYAAIMIRSAANPPMDQNSPEDIFTLDFFISRGQYGQRPLFYGHSFLSEPAIKEVKDGYMYDYKKGKTYYRQKPKETENEKDQYIQTGNQYERIYAQNMLFPRMYSSEHAEIYKQWVDIKGKQVTYNRAGEIMQVTVPTQWENIKFFLGYQLNFMYWRYFLWNFVGRQNDIQGNGEIEHGNWISGIPIIDRHIEGDSNLIPTELKENKGRNVYYGLPLILGIIGLLWQCRQGNTGRNSFFIVFMLFFMTGIAIILYLNQTPTQVRERDYAYAGSFYAFAIWIGMGVAGIWHLLQKRIKGMPGAVLVSLLCLLIPIQMASQTWDDHDRSGRYSCRDIGQNYLTSASESNHPIVFSMGDNDTFPLWYNQEVEGFRTDIRTCNASYLHADWYIDAMKRDYYDSPAMPISWEPIEYKNMESEAIPVRPELKQSIDELYRVSPEEARKQFGDNPYEYNNIMKYWIRSDNPRMRVFPTDSIVIKLDKEAIRRSDLKIPEALNGEIPDYMEISLKGRNYVIRGELMMLETLVNCNWERPVYIAVSVGADGRFCFENNLRQEGMLLRITPFNTTGLNARLDSERTYDSMMNKFKWGGVENPDVYMDETVRRMYVAGRMYFSLLAQELMKEGKTDKALEVIDHCLKAIPDTSIPFDFPDCSYRFAEYYYQLGQTDKADAIMSKLADKSIEYITWYLSMNNYQWPAVTSNCMTHLYILNEVNKIMEKYNSTLTDRYWAVFDELYKQAEESVKIAGY